MLSLAASAETRSEHPLGKAIVEYAKSKEVPLMESNSFNMITGKGIFAKVGSHSLLCGNEKFLTENGVWIDNKVQSALERLRHTGKSLYSCCRRSKMYRCYCAF